MCLCIGWRRSDEHLLSTGHYSVPPTRYYKQILLIICCKQDINCVYSCSGNVQTDQPHLDVEPTARARPARGYRLALPGTGAGAAKSVRLELCLLLHIPQSQGNCHTKGRIEQCVARPIPWHRCRRDQRAVDDTILGGQHTTQKQVHE